MTMSVELAIQVRITNLSNPFRGIHHGESMSVSSPVLKIFVDKRVGQFAFERRASDLERGVLKRPLATA
jgi:hypothetical protein